MELIYRIEVNGIKHHLLPHLGDEAREAMLVVGNQVVLLFDLEMHYMLANRTDPFSPLSALHSPVSRTTFSPPLPII
jgi:hypothetical protein